MHRALVLAAVPALALLTPTGTGPTAPLLSAVSVAAWACTGWLLLVALLEHSSRLPGLAGRAAAGLVRRIAPASVRAAVGASLAIAVLTGSAAHAEDRTPTIAGSSSDVLDWPGLAPETALPPASPTAVPHPSPTAVPHASPRPVAPAGPAVRPAGEVVVRAGDSLWSIARRTLGPGARDRQVAQTWPRWWAANRSVVGDHPDLIHPGDRLSAP